MKKLLSLVMAGILTGVSCLSLTANANVVWIENGVDEDGKKYVEWFDLQDYFDEESSLTYHYFKSTTAYEGTGQYEYLYSTSTGAPSYGSFMLSFSDYENLTEDDVSALSEYLSQNYPEIELERYGSGYLTNTSNYRLVNENSLTPEEQFKIAIDIKDNTGLVCSHNYLLSTTEGKSYKEKDVNNDGSVDASDASDVLMYYALNQTNESLEDHFSAEQLFCLNLLGDVDGDEKIDAADAAFILFSYADAQTSK